MHLATGKLMRSFVTVTDILFYRWCLIQKAKAFYNGRSCERKKEEEKEREREEKK